MAKAKKTINALIMLALTIGVVSLNACKKEKKSPTPSNTITATISGTNSTFNTNAIALTGSLNSTNFTAVQGEGANGTNLSVTINGTLTAGKTYSAATGNEPTLLYSTSTDDFLNDDTSVANSVSVTITSVSATAVQGTFKGDVVNTVINTDGHAKITKSITNGAFNVSISK